MMLRNVLLKTLRDQRRSLLFWAVGLGLLAVTMAAFYPTVRDMGDLIQDYVDAFPPELMALFGTDITEITTPAGYLNAELYGLMVPLLFLVFAVAAGSGAVAGEEDRGTLELLLSGPVRRWRVVLEKFGAMVFAGFALGLALWAVLAVSAVPTGLNISLLRLGEGTIAAVLLGLVFGTFALAVGCLRPGRGFSIGVTAALAVGLFVLNALSVIIEVMEPFRLLSPFYYYNAAQPLTNGLDPVHALVLVGIIVVLVPLALIGLERRDLKR